MTPHINAVDGAFAKTVLMPGDPLRAKLLADTFLEDVKLVTDVRNVFGFTGTYKGVKVSVMASGMGMPSIGIYSHELFTHYGVENIIRIGSAGSYSAKLNVLDVALADYAYADSSYAKVMSGVDDKQIKPSQIVNDTIMATAKEVGVECKLSHVYSSDVFYSEESWQAIAERTQCDCVEMESFALFHNAKALGKNAACLLTISDSFVTAEALPAEQRQKSFMQMMQLALESAIRL